MNTSTWPRATACSPASSVGKGTYCTSAKPSARKRSSATNMGLMQMAPIFTRRIRVVSGGGSAKTRSGPRARRPAALANAAFFTNSRRLIAPLLFDHLVGPLQERWRDREPERPGGPEVDDQLELRGLLDGQVGGPGALEDLVDVV